MPPTLASATPPSVRRDEPAPASVESSRPWALLFALVGLLALGAAAVAIVEWRRGHWSAGEGTAARSTTMPLVVAVVPTVGATPSSAAAVLSSAPASPARTTSPAKPAAPPPAPRFAHKLGFEERSFGHYPDAFLNQQFHTRDAAIEACYAPIEKPPSLVNVELFFTKDGILDRASNVDTLGPSAALDNCVRRALLGVNLGPSKAATAGRIRILIFAR